MSWNDHDHRGEYAEDRHDHDGDYPPLHHRHYDLENADERARQRITGLQDEIDGLRRELGEAMERIRVLDRLRPSCVLCHDAVADRQTGRGPACSDCAGDLPYDGPDPDRPETWAFPGPEDEGSEEGCGNG